MSKSQITYLDQGAITYTLGTGIGCWASSMEDIPLGTTRVIKGVLMHTWKEYKRWWGKEVWWCPVDEKFNTYENLREWEGRRP